MSTPQPFAPLLRFALMAAVVAGAMVSFSAARGVAVALTAQSMPTSDFSFGRFRTVIPYAKEQEEAVRAQERATLNAIEGMSTSRVMILMALSSAASLVFVASLRLRWTVNAPKASVARLLGGSAFVAAVFRTLDGAQELVITRAAITASGKALIAAAVPDAEAQASLALAMSTFVSVGWTAFVVGLFVLLGTYFRSDKVQSSLGAAEERTNDDE